MATHKKYSADYDKICLQFWKTNTLETCRSLYQFFKQYFYYVVESDSVQTLRSPAAIIKLGTNPKIGLDCKSYSLFIGGVLDALSRRGYPIKWCYRFASYKPYDRLPHHVFVVVNPGSSNEIWCDPVINTFNWHKPYNFKTDRFMSLVAVSGIGKAGKGKKKFKNFIKKSGKLLVKLNPATVSARNSFLAIVGMNVFGIARKLQIVVAKKPNELKKFWQKLGGDYKKLVNTINKGAKHGKKVHGDEIGALPAIAAAIAAATPIIIKVKALMKSAGINTDKLEDAAKGVLSKLVKNKVAKEESGEDGSGEETSSLQDFNEDNNVSPESDNNQIEDIIEGGESDSYEPGVDEPDDSNALGFLSKNNPFRNTRNYNSLFRNL